MYASHKINGNDRRKLKDIAVRNTCYLILTLDNGNDNFCIQIVCILCCGVRRIESKLGHRNAHSTQYAEHFRLFFFSLENTRIEHFHRSGIYLAYVYWMCCICIQAPLLLAALYRLMENYSRNKKKKNADANKTKWKQCAQCDSCKFIVTQSTDTPEKKS